MMPGLFALVQHPASAEVQSSLQHDEAVFAFLGDIYITCEPDRVVPSPISARRPLEARSHRGQFTKNKSLGCRGGEPAGVRELGGSEADPLRVWGPKTSSHKNKE